MVNVKRLACISHPVPTASARRVVAVAAVVFAGVVFVVSFATATVFGGLQEQAQAASVEIRPESPTLRVGESIRLTAVVRDAAGNALEGVDTVFLSLARGALSVTPDGRVEAHRAGEHRVVVLVPDRRIDTANDRIRDTEPGLRASIIVTVPQPPVTRVEFVDAPEIFYTGTSVLLDIAAFDASGARRDDVEVSVISSAPQTAAADIFGQVTALGTGWATLTARAGDVVARWNVRVEENPIASIELTASQDEARTGDVLHFEASGRDGRGRATTRVPISYALTSWPDPGHPEAVGAGAPAQVTEDGRFVAEQPGVYTVVAVSGEQMAQRSVRIVPRNVQQEIEFVGHARVGDRVTSDLWVWEGIDGRDYAVHGTWNAEGHAYFYDVTDPANMLLIDTIQVDARTVNDVKVSEDGTICVISREGASNRRNGIVILDVSNPRDVQIISTFDDQLTGGVHNIFIHDSHVYAVNNGRRWDIINIEDPRNPHRVGRFETSSPGRSVHDVWVRDGIVYQAGRTDGAVMVDVGGGEMGGSPANPIEMGRLGQLTGWNHSAWPFRSKSTGKFYFVAGDEAFYNNPLAPEAGGILWREKIPSRARGWIHFLEFDDPGNPKEVARYQVPDSGPHNYWLDWDNEILYVAHFDAGLRVVDVSGELMGDLYRQGREIAKFYSDDGQGFTPNAPFAWGPQPHKGTIFFADFNSGLWAVRLVPRDESEQ